MYTSKLWPNTKFQLDAEHEVRHRFGGGLDYVIDIGAHVGWFTLAFSDKYPSAKIFAYEPSSAIFEALEKHVKLSAPVERLKNIKLINAGLADGKDHNLGLTSRLRGVGRITHNQQNTEIIKTKTIKQIIEENQIDLNKKIGIKIDCEGSEKYLLNEESTEVMKQMNYISLELHFKSNCRLDGWDNGLLPWENYNDWINKNFSDSFKHTYEYGRKHRGWGMFYIKKTK